MQENKPIRLDKYLADMKAGTRSQVKEMIRKGRVSVDGNVVKESDIKVLPTQMICLDGEQLNYVSVEYLMLNKPAGVLTATMDKHAKTVLDLVDSARKDLFPVGRLDKDTEGLLILTNDGALAHDLLHPKKHVNKTYYAKVSGKFPSDIVEQFAAGLKVDDSLTAMPAELKIIPKAQFDEELNEIMLTIQEGKFHQVKRMFEAVGCHVVYLKRVSFGTLPLDETLATGEYRPLTEDEIAYLKSVTR